MAHQDPRKTDQKLQQDANQYYGDQTISGQNPDPSSDDNASNALREVLGNKPNHNENIGYEINKDEQKLVDSEGVNEPNQEIKIEPISENEDESLTGAAGASENLVGSTDDPYENLTDADFKKKNKDA